MPGTTHFQRERVVRPIILAFMTKEVSACRRMKCPSCATADLIRDTRDVCHACTGETTLIAAVTGDFCPA